MKKILLTLTTLCLYPLFGYAQIIEHNGNIIDISSTISGGEVKACQSIRLNPGFSFTASPEDSLILKIDQSICSVLTETGKTILTSISPNQNFIISVTPLDETSLASIFGNQISIADNTRALISVRYYDGLGRPVQTVQNGFGPKGQDLVTAVEYDKLGRVCKNYLPVPISGNGGDYVSMLDLQTASVYSVYNDQRPYSEIVYEPSPLNRVEKQYGPGKDWKPNHNDVGGHPVATAYKTNSTTNETLKCVYFFVSGDALIKNGNYPDDQLYVTETKDEDGKVMYQFTDKLGRTVLTRKLLPTETNAPHVDTYYVYDDFGSLRFTVPPMAADSLTEDNVSWDESNEILTKYAYLYQYDERQRCTAKRIPGCEWQKMVYDRADRLIFSQDGEQRKKGNRMFYVYDVFGRPVITGLCSNSDNEVDGHKSLNTSATFTDNTNNAGFAGTGYILNNLTILNPEILTVNYYDNYAFLDLPAVATHKTALSYAAKTDYGKQYANSTCPDCSAKGLLTGNRIGILNEAGRETMQAIYYDEKSRVIQSKSTVYQGGYQKQHLAYTFTGQPVETLTEYEGAVSTCNGEIDFASEHYTHTYDQAGRLKKTALNGTVIEYNTYNELGQLQSKQQGNDLDLWDAPLTSYTYNLRGWVKTITERVTDFLQTLYYQDNNNGSKLYNGNIAQMTYLYKKHTNLPKTAERTCYYNYDGLNRLSFALLSSEIYDMDLENVSYDKHGNPKSINRTLNFSVEERKFSYKGNQKATVSGYTSENPNLVLPLSGEFKYNDNGALTSDTGRDIVAIRYNLLNLPDTIQFKNGNAIYYTYNAAGQKLQTTHITVKPDLASPITLDVGVVQPLTQSETLSKLTTNYIGNHVLEGDELTMTLFPGGYIRKMLEFDGNENALGCFPKYHYYIQDYLGNNRDVLCTDNNGNWTVVQRNEYTPFGVSFPQTVGDAAAQPYKFGGKELDRMHGLDFYDFHARVYAPKDGGFPTVDPLAEKYPDVSPYVYCLNNPVRYTDPTGMVVETDEQSRNNIKNSLTKQEAKYVKYNKNGVLDTKRLNKSKSTSENMTALKALANSETTYSFQVAKAGHDGEEFYDNASDNFNRGVTEMPGAEKNPSPDDKVYIFVGNVLSEQQQVMTTAHEAYGHAYVYETTRNIEQASHTYKSEVQVISNPITGAIESIELIKIPTNTSLENRIKTVVNQAKKNYESRKKK